MKIKTINVKNKILCFRFYCKNNGVLYEDSVIQVQTFSCLDKLGRFIKLFFKFHSNHMNTRQVWYSNGPNVASCKMVWFCNSSPKTEQKFLVLWSKMPGLRIVCKIQLFSFSKLEVLSG